jgi:hypothetical protein
MVRPFASHADSRGEAAYDHCRTSQIRLGELLGRLLHNLDSVARRSPGDICGFLMQIGPANGYIEGLSPADVAGTDGWGKQSM